MRSGGCGRGKKEDFIAVFKDRNFWVFVIFIVGTWSFYNILINNSFLSFMQVYSNHTM